MTDVPAHSDDDFDPEHPDLQHEDGAEASEPDDLIEPGAEPAEPGDAEPGDHTEPDGGAEQDGD